PTRLRNWSRSARRAATGANGRAARAGDGSLHREVAVVGPAMHVPTLSIVGVGLLGGSIALACRQRRLAGRIVGCDPSPDVLARARERGMLDETTEDPCQAVAKATLAVFCTPVDRLADVIGSCADSCRPGTLLTDVGSTKSNIVRRLAGRLPAGVSFV